MAKDVSDRVGKGVERTGPFTTVSGVPIERLYTPEDIADLDYEKELGDPGQPPAIWPLDSGIPRPTGSPVLVMMVHPHCSCTGASLEELARAMVRGQGKAEVYVLFLKPAGLGQEWVKTKLWSRAAEIPGVSVLADDRGNEARRFGVATSGHVLLYDRGGSLRFSGGITDARGHAGDNPGAEALVKQLLGAAPAPERFFVFGCSLRDPGRSPAERTERWTL